MKGVVNTFFICLILSAALGAGSFAEHIKVDMDTRSDATAAGFVSWQSSHGRTKTFGDITVNLEMPNLPADTEWKINWYNKNGLNKYELAMDCLYANFDDDEVSHPSYDGGTIVMTIEGLTEGEHSLITYHNAPWPITKYDRAICEIKVSVDDVEKFTVQPSQYVTNDADIESTFFTINATAGAPVVVEFEPVGNPNTQIFTAVLCGFEIDNPAAVEAYATNPVPYDGDEHVFANNDEAIAGSAGMGYVQLGWSPSSLANDQDIYFGTSEAEVTDANISTTGIYQGRVGAADANFSVTNLDSKNIYYWRVDTVKSAGSITKGYIWKFRTRHLAFPTAEGYGRFARGGRFGQVIEITTLEDYNEPGGEIPIPGSLRYAMEIEKGPRVAVFRVGGNINLERRISIPSDGGDVYVAGQTAPGEGICVTRYGFGALGASDVVIRFIRNRVGDYCKKSMDGMGLSSCDHSMIDHCSISWTIDEGHSSRSAHNITFQRNIISEALHDSYHYLDDDRTKTETHAFAASISGAIGSYHHNLLAHCTARNWSLAGGLEQDGLHYAGHVDIRNNVVYNWLSKTTDGGCKRVNFVNNYYKPGPAVGVTWLMRPDGDELSLGDMQQFYIVGNRMVGILDDPNSDNWNHVQPQAGTEAELRVDSPFFESYVATQTANQAYYNVIDDVGAIRPMRDEIDERIINEVVAGTYTYRGSKKNLPGIIDSQEDVGGYKEYSGGPVPDDSDQDGMPNWWEKWLGFDPNDSNDGNGDDDLDGYTNLEDYLEYLAEGGKQLQSAPQVNISAIPLSGIVPLEVQFDANAFDAEEDVLSYHWEFGDGNTSSLASPSYVYTTPGNYDICVTVSDEIDEVTQCLSIEALSPFGFIVDRALVNLGWGFSNTGRVIMCGRMTPCNPNPDDIISISCDGVKLFEAPFSTFVQHSNYPYIYKLNQWNIHVGLDLRRGIISVIRTRIGLSGLDTSDGVDVELRMGNCTGEDNITLNNMMGRYWFYSKPIRGVKKLSAANVKTSSDTKRK